MTHAHPATNGTYAPGAYGVTTQRGRDARETILATIVEMDHLGGANIRALAEACDHSCSDTRKHLQQLMRDGLVVRNHFCGPNTFYRIRDRVTAEEMMRLALELIDRNGCTNFTSGRCWNYGRQRGAEYGADAWCDACTARDALGSEA